MKYPDNSHSDAAQQQQPITVADERKAVKRVLKAIGDEPQKLGEQFLKWFGEGLLKQSDFRPTVETISKECFKETSKKSTKVKNALTAAHLWLDRFYANAEQRGCIQMHPGKPPKLGHATSFYSVEYRRDPSAVAIAEGRLSSQDPVVRRWQAMVHALSNIKQISLVYDTPAIGPASLSDNILGLWAGSGEVAAACILGQHLAQLSPAITVEPRRWRDMPRSNLRPKNQCIIILGAAIDNENYEYLRKRDEWKKQQHFHFVGPAEAGGYSHICRGKIDRPSHQEQKSFRYNDPPNTDYALVSFFRDRDNNGTLIALQGITTVSTLTAVDFMCSRGKLNDLDERLFKGKNSGKGLGQPWPSFEAVIRISLDKNGNPENTRIECVHLYSIPPSRAASGFNSGLKPTKTS